jgi:hypothetical protein
MACDVYRGRFQWMLSSKIPKIVAAYPYGSWVMAYKDIKKI